MGCGFGGWGRFGRKVRYLFYGARGGRTVNAAAGVVECERRDVRLAVAGDKLRVDAPTGAVTEELRAAPPRERAAIVAALQADAQARAAGLVVLEPGTTYHAAPDRFHEVLVQREGPL